MPYVGQQPLVGEYIVLDSISTSATDTFALERNSAAFAPATAEQCIVSLNGVTQAPGDNGGFTIQGTNIVFDSALTSSDVIDYIVVMGNPLSAGVPSTGSVQGTHLSSNLFRDPLRINNATISSNITIASGERAMVAGDISVANSITLTVNGVLTVV